jgi:hypothetical protein
MLGTCYICGKFSARYGTPEEMHRPCECGSTKFWCVIFQFTSDRWYKGPRYDLVDLSTNEVLDTSGTLPE